MLLASVICMFVATIMLIVVDCFLKNHKVISLLLQILSYTALFCSAFTLAHYKNDLSIFSILLIASILPQIITLFDAKEIFGKQNLQAEPQLDADSQIDTETPVENFETELEKIEEQTENISEEDLAETEENFAETVDNAYEEELELATKPKKSKLSDSDGFLLKSIGIFLTSAFLSVCGLVLGLESVYLYLLALTIGMLGTFVLLVIKKNLNLFDIISYALVFLSAGLAIAQILTVLLYSTSLTNILYSIGMFVYAGYSVFYVLTKSKFSNLIYMASIIILLSILFV